MIYNNKFIAMEAKDFKSKYQTLNLLGQGSFGSVYRVKAKDGSKDPKYYVAKKILLEGLSQEELTFAFGEIRILEKINKEINPAETPYVVTYKQFFKTQLELIIIMECCQSGDLSSFLKKMKASNQRLQEKIIVFWFVEMLLGLKALHNKKILHRDLKSANVFLTHDFHVKIGDFGISKILQRSTAITCIGSPLYLSPEVCNNEPYGVSSDIWALGCILYELCTQKYPFKASNLIILAKMITQDEIQPIPQHYSNQLRDIVSKMFIKDKKKRITLDQILKTPFIANAAKQLKNFKGNFQELAQPINNHIIKQIKIQQDFDDDTMKTIGSVVQKTCEKQLDFSSKPSTKAKLTFKNESQLKQTSQSIKLAAQAKKSFLQQTADETGMFSRADFKNKSLSGASKTQNQLNMDKMQTINIEMLANQIKSLTIIQNQDDFEDVEFPQVKPKSTKQANKPAVKKSSKVLSNTLK